MNGKRDVRELSKEEQECNLEERAFQLKIKIQASALPKSAYYVECFMCHNLYYIDLANKGNLTNSQITTYLVANGFQVGGRGYECPECFGGYVQAVVEYVTGGRKDDGNVVEDTADTKGLE